MLKDLYFSIKEKDLDLNCAETMLYACNENYSMGLDDNTMKLSSAFGGGMCIEDSCGAITGGLMALGYLFVKERAHSSEIIKQIVTEYIMTFMKETTSINCCELKEKYRTEEEGCQKVLVTSLDCLEQIIEKYKEDRIR